MVFVDEALQIFGGYGYMAEQAVEHYFRDACAIEVDLWTEEELKVAMRFFMARNEPEK